MSNRSEGQKKDLEKMERDAAREKRRSNTLSIVLIIAIAAMVSALMCLNYSRMDYQWINIMGLVLDMTGVGMLFRTGLPPDLNMLDMYYDASVKEEFKPIIKQRELRTKIAFGFVIIGFFFQLFAAFISIQ